MNNRFLEDVKARVELLDIVRRYHNHPIKKSGKNYMTTSPFRNEKTPSFSISPEKQMWYDFGNAEGGDIISFVEKAENCNFGEALEILADMAGLEMPQDFGGNSSVSKEKKQDIFSLHKKVTEFFAIALQQSKEAMCYVENRGITKKMVKSWELGYGGDMKNGLTQFLLKSGFSEALIADSGVSFERSFGDKKMQDRFCGRLMIPIHEAKQGDIVAFSGREILGREKIAKYVNSPENPVYHKSSILFGLHKARKEIKEKDFVILVEGNFDVIFAHENELRNTVATCGTSLTEDHLRILKRLTKNIYLAFDSDLAGKKATLRATEMCLRTEQNPFIVEITEANDFGEFLENPANAIVLQKKIKVAPKALDFFFEKFSQKNIDGSIEGEKRFLDSFFYFLKLVPRPIEVDYFLQKLAQKLSRPKSVIEEEFKKFSSQKKDYLKPKFQEEKTIQFSREENFVGFLFTNWSFFQKTLQKQKEKILNLFVDSLPKTLLQKKIEEKAFTQEEEKMILAWEMFCENLYEDDHSDLLKREFGLFATLLQEDKGKREEGVTDAEREFIKKYKEKREQRGKD
ncbi:DNA primase [Candidatus Gracilibacteria bacterium]|nr:DNA primase [Candidatus Gracilibacteria bacterium]